MPTLRLRRDLRKRYAGENGRLVGIKNVATWLSLGIAIIALVLSQLPPIPSYFALPELKINCAQ